MPTAVHTLLATFTIAVSFVALRAIVHALNERSSRIVDEVNRDLGA